MRKLHRISRKLRGAVSAEDGQTLVLTVLSMGLLLGFMALALDVGLLFRAKRNTQIAADSAAVAAALDYLYNGNKTSAQTQGKAAASANGITDGVSGNVVTINVPPNYGPNATAAGFVEAVVQQPNPLFFMSMFSHSSSMVIAARAVAGVPTAGTACIWLMTPSGNGLKLQGHYDIEAPGCGIYVNSNTADAIGVTGNGGTVNAAYLNVVGNSTLQHDTNPTPATMNAAPRKNPFGNVTGPDPTSACTSGNTLTAAATSSSNLPSPSNGVVCFNYQTCSGKGKKLTCTGAPTTLTAGVDLPGGAIYVFENGVTVGGTLTVGDSTSGATLDIYGGTFDQANSTLSIISPTTGPYNGIAILQPANNGNQLQVQFGSGNQKLDGYIYAPGAEVYLQDHGGGITATGIVALDMFVKASTITIPSYDQAHPTTTPNRVVTLVE